MHAMYILHFRIYCIRIFFCTLVVFMSRYLVCVVFYMYANFHCYNIIFLVVGIFKERLSEDSDLVQLVSYAS